MNINVKLTSETGTLPTKAHATDAGYDVYADEDVVLQVGKPVTIRLGFAIEIPEGYFGDLTGRSGLSSKTNFRVKRGIIDHGYTEEVRVMAELYPFEIIDVEQGSVRISPNYVVKKGDRIGQLIIRELPATTLVVTDSLADAERGNNGFGSTGV